MEYSFALADALAYRFGYRDADPVAAVARYTAEAHRFSLIGSGVLEAQASAKLLLIGGHGGLDLPGSKTCIIMATQARRNKDLVAAGRPQKARR